MFTESEVRFLSLEHATAGLRAFPHIDPTTLRNRESSTRVINRLLEARAKTLGRTFTEFQAKMNPVVGDDLMLNIQANKLW